MYRNWVVSNHETVAAELEKIKEAHAATDELLKKSRSDLKEKETQLTSMLADKDVLNKALSGTIEEQKEKIARMGEELSSAQDIKEKFKGMISSLEEAEKSHMAATQEIGVSIVDENTLQGTFNRNPEIYSFTKVNEALITASMGSSIFSDNGYKAVEVAVNYLKLQDSGLERIGYQGAQGTVYNEFYIFDTTFGGTTIFWYYVNTKDLRLFTETEYYNIVNP